MLKSGFWILKSNAKSRKWISPQRNPSSSWIAIKKTENGFHGLSGEIYSREQSGFLFANYACACKTAVHLELFFKPFFGFPKKNGKKGNPRTGISALKSFFGFRVWLQIRNTVEVLLTDTFVTGKLYFRPPSQNAVQWYLFFRSESWEPREARAERIWADPIERDFKVGKYRIRGKAVLYLQK